MSYNYEEQKKELFSERGQVQFIKIRDKVNYLLKEAGAVRMQEATSEVTGDSWTHIACLDRMVELGEIKELTKGVWGQFRVFTRKIEGE